MYIKGKLRNKAIKLREQGLTYNEILSHVCVSKSTLSLWLRDVGLAKKQKQRLTEKKLAAIKKGGEARHRERIKRTKEIKTTAKKEIKEISDRELWLIGIALYWAEGTKEKYGRATMIEFSNTDSKMINIYLYWLRYSLRLDITKDVVFTIYIHETKRFEIEKVKKFWSDITNLPISEFNRVFYKKHKPKTNRKNIGDNYYGTLKVIVRKSTDLNRKIAGWIEGMVKSLN